MTRIKQIAKYFFKQFFPAKAMSPGKAYDLWSEEYDKQTDNVLIALDEKLFNRLAEKILIDGKVIVDIGCGTGRHWKNILARRPGKLVGYDVSEGMLKELKRKFPDSETHLLKGNQLHRTGDKACDLIISNLTIGYISNLESAFGEWDRILKPGADILITDFHPKALAAGSKRTFSWNKKTVEISNYIYTIEQIEEMAKRPGWSLLNLIEMTIDDSVKQYFEKNKSLHVFERLKGDVVIYGIHLKKNDAVVER